jgi:DNA-binding beta-propeller fold protein YncE
MPEKKAVKANRFSRHGALVWPDAPAPPRIGYVMSLRSPDDLGKGRDFLKMALDLLLGKSFERIIKPFGITVDSNGRVIVVDTAYSRLHVFDLVKKKYKAITKAGKFSFTTPIGVAVDIRDNIYMTDSGAGKVFVMNPRGRFLFGIGNLKRPTGIAINQDENELYVVDTLAHHVKVYDLRGVELRTIGARGDDEGEFNYPVDIFIDKKGDIYVSDSMNFRLQVFDKMGRYITSFGIHGDGTGSMARPKGVAVDKDGNIYVVDAVFDTVQIFDRDGRFLLNFGRSGSGAGEFQIPGGIFIDKDSYIYVSDSYNRRVQVFEYISEK